MRYPGYGRWRTGVAACLVIVALLAVGAGTLWALTTAGFQLSWWTVDGGGGRSEGSGFVLSGTAGQPDAGLLIGPGYTLGGGFWAGGALAPAGHAVYLPAVLR
jgi:hypothetical protein